MTVSLWEIWTPETPVERVALVTGVLALQPEWLANVVIVYNGFWMTPSLPFIPRLVVAHVGRTRPRAELVTSVTKLATGDALMPLATWERYGSDLDARTRYAESREQTLARHSAEL